jgi:dynein heavy chain, axonemal
MKHRGLMLDMEELRFVDSLKNGDTKDIITFTEGQKERRKEIAESIVKISERSRDNVFECISKVMHELRERIVTEITLDEERKKNNPIQSSNTIVMKRKASNNVFEKLGFPEGMTYGHRSSLRKVCSRFLRFAYLVDFLSLESLANIYIGSVRDLIDRLQTLDENCDMQKVMTMDFDEAMRQPAPPQRGSEPLFSVQLTLNDKVAIPGNEVKKVVCDEFILPPRGTSKDSDFDLLCHLELEPEKAEKGEEEEAAAGGEAGQSAAVVEIKYKSVVPNIQKYWLQMKPNANDYI